MNNKFLNDKYLNEFLEQCKDFSQDLSKELDSKHSEIILKSHKILKDNKKNFIKNFKDWNLQSDLFSPIQFTLDHLKILKKKDLIKNFLKIIFLIEDKDFKRSFLDDIEILEKVGALDLLHKNPVHKTPGCTSFYKIKGCSTNNRWNRYAYLANQIFKKKLLETNQIHVDIGTYYGGLQSFLFKYSPQNKYFLVDFNHQLLRSYIFLKNLFPNVAHFLPDNIDYNSDFINSKNGFYYISIDNFFKMKNLKPNLISNFFSLGEMTNQYFDRYLDSEIFRKSKFQYFVNRFVSGPFFERTYDNIKNIFDYIKNDQFQRVYTDVFPIHHYSIVNRYLFNIKAKRPISSPYFEIILKNENWR